MATTASGAALLPRLLLLTGLLLRPTEGFLSSDTSPPSSSSSAASAEPFYCKAPGLRRLPHHRLCDGIFDCAGREDETNCTHCQPGAWRCITSRECILELNKCDSVINCGDASDEDPQSCLADNCLGANRFKCANGQCVSVSERCDGQPVCADWSDELDCCRPDQFQCTLSEHRPSCIPRAAFCDGKQDCSHGEDERICPRCSKGAFHCDSGLCIQGARRCNGVEDCDGGEDELGCPVDPSPSSSGRRTRQPGSEGRGAAMVPRLLPLTAIALTFSLLRWIQTLLC